MHQNSFAWLLILVTMGVLTIVACQPQVVLVDVTRIVEVTAERAANPTAAPDDPTIAPEFIEVTRIVDREIEMMRVVTATVVQEVEVVVTEPPPGSAGRPIRLVFPPTADAVVIARRGQVLAEALAEATGLTLEVGVMDDEAAVIRLLCAAPADTVGFLSAAGYVLVSEQCDGQLGSVAVRTDGLTRQWGMMVARRDSTITTIDDLAGKRWAVPETDSVTKALYFQALLAESGIEVGEIVMMPGDNSALLAVYEGQVDVATAAYVPPILPFDERPWQFGEDSPEIWRRVGISPRRSPIGYVLVNGEPEFGGYRLRDARSGVIDIVPSIYDETRVIVLSAPIPNDTIAFGAEFPLAMARRIIVALEEFAASDSCTLSLCSADFYGWTGVEPVEDAAYDPLRFMIETLDISPEKLPRP